MAVTFRQMMNRVLNNLGEEEISSATTAIVQPYHLLLRNIFNQVKEEVEDAHNWRALRVRLTATVAANGETIALTSANERSRVMRVQVPLNGMERSLVFDITTTTSPVRIRERDLADLWLLRENDPDTETLTASYFAVDNTVADVVNLEVYPSATGTAQNYIVYMTVPQARFEGTSSDIGTSISIPHMPIELGMTYFAMEERGEELGPNGLFTEVRYRDAMGRAIARDAAESGDLNLVPV